MKSTYFKWEWVKDENVVSKSTERFNSRVDCFTDAMESERDAAEMIITCYDANKPERKVHGSFELGHGIQIHALEYNGKPRIDIRKWEKSAQGKGKCHSHSHSHSQ